MKFTLTHVHALSELVRIDMMTLEEYCKHGDSFFAGRLKKFYQDYEKEPQTWNEDHAVDTRIELQTHQEYNAYFGLMMAYSSFERYLQRLYVYTGHIATVPELRDVIFQPSTRMTLEEFGRFLRGIGIKISDPPYEWNKIIKLHAFRNAIAHQGGEVTRENENKLKPHGYKLGDDIKATIDDVLENIRLVRETAEMLTKDYVKILREKKLLK
jgi:enamine deaminase RidA (YjgF/YER057c/UK114 family)